MSNLGRDIVRKISSASEDDYLSIGMTKGPFSDPSSKVALVHYWLVNMRGGEKVLQSLAGMFPDAPIFTHAVDRAALAPDLQIRDIRTTFIQRLPQASRRYQQYLPLMPLALEELDLRGYDLVISSESGPAKGVIVGPGTAHICYCHSPMRYIWDMYHDYLDKSSFPVRLMMRPLCHYLRMWDQSSAVRVDQFVANSRYVAERVRKFYGRTSEVVAPPVQVEAFTPADGKEDYYLFFGELVGYKRADLAVEAFRASGRKLVVAGKGEQFHALRKAAPPNVTFTGTLSFSEVKYYLTKAKALVFPGVEDFGIIPVEAMASGTPVIAFRKGGALDSILEDRTGVFFDDQSVESLNSAIDRFESGISGITLENMLAQARQFSPDQFERKFKRIVNDVKDSQKARMHGPNFE